MHDLPLPGIPGSNPIGAMAAFGLFRILAEQRPFGDVRLSWRFDSDWRPVFHTENEADVDAVIDFLISRQPERSTAAFLLWNDDIKCDPEKTFREELKKTRDQWLLGENGAGARGDERVRFFCAFGSESIAAKSTSDVKPTAFHMTAGQQRFLKSAVDVSRSLDPRQRSSKRQNDEQRHEELIASWREALSGPWRYCDTEHSLGWDPTTEGLYALSDRSPSAAGPRSVRGAVWLAFESLPLFPTVPGEKKLLTTCFDLEDEMFMWPVWEPSITLESLVALLQSPNMASNGAKMSELRLRGVAALFRTQCVRDDNGRGTFRNAVEIK